MSDMTIPEALGRISGALPDSPLAVFRTHAPGHVNCLFANTVHTQALIRARHRDLIGVFHGEMNRFAVRDALLTGARPPRG